MTKALQVLLEDQRRDYDRIIDDVRAQAEAFRDISEEERDWLVEEVRAWVDADFERFARACNRLLGDAGPTDEDRVH